MSKPKTGAESRAEQRASATRPLERHRGRRPGMLGGLAISFPAVEPAITEARTQVARWLRAGAEDEVLVSDVAHAVTEACTNVVVHAYRNRGPAGDRDLPRFLVTGERTPGAVELTVSDDGGGFRPRTDSPGLGLGVSLIAALSDHVTVSARPDGSGTAVVMSFTAAGAHSRGGCMH